MVYSRMSQLIKSGFSLTWKRYDTKESFFYFEKLTERPKPRRKNLRRRDLKLPMKSKNLLHYAILSINPPECRSISCLLVCPLPCRRSSRAACIQGAPSPKGCRSAASHRAPLAARRSRSSG